MIAIDTNILVYAHRSDSPFHASALGAVRNVVEGDRAWAIPWPCVHEFLAKVTHPRIFKEPTPMERALTQIEEWRRSPSSRLIGETDDYESILSRVLLTARVVGAKIHDARIAAICEAHGVTELWTADRDFTRFAQLATRNPL